MLEIIENITHSLYEEANIDKENSRIYKIHKYWARKPWYIVEKYIEQYSLPGELVMDPFCGSGCTGLEAIINGRNFLGQDLNPIALAVSDGTLQQEIPWDSLWRDIDEVSHACSDRILSLYEADQRCEQCGKTMYFKHINIGPKFQKNISGCVCCIHCRTKSVRRALTDAEIEKREIQQQSLVIRDWIPDTEFPEKFYKDRFSYKGIASVNDMYTVRNLYALSLLYAAILRTEEPNRQFLTLAFTNTLLHVSKLKSERVRPLGVNNYWIPDDYMEENVWIRFQDRLKNLVAAKKQQEKRIAEKQKNGISYGKWNLKQQSALHDMGEECVDYFFTDPPYGDTIQYSELSFIWNAWLQKEYPATEEIIINPVQNKGTSEFSALLAEALRNIYRALKDQHYLTLCFQNKDSAIWKEVIRHCREIGFKLTDVSIYNTYGNPFNRNWADFSPKSDIYVTFQKGRTDRFPSYAKRETIPDIIREIVAYMQKNQIPFDNNRLYDYTIGYLIWAIYLNREEIDAQDFNLKTFSQFSQPDSEKNSGI